MTTVLDEVANVGTDVGPDGSPPTCRAVTRSGTRCEHAYGLDADGLCVTHRRGGERHMRAIASLGGKAKAARAAALVITSADLRTVDSPEAAKAALIDVRVWVATKRLGHHEGAVLVRAIEGWLKADAAATTKELVGELRAALDEKQQQIAKLERALADRSRALRMAP